MIIPRPFLRPCGYKEVARGGGAVVTCADDAGARRGMAGFFCLEVMTQYSVTPAFQSGRLFYPGTHEP